MPNPNLTYTNLDHLLAAETTENPYPVEELGWSRLPDKNFYFKDDHHRYILPYKGINPIGKDTIDFIHGKVETSRNASLGYINGISDEQLLEVLIDRSEYFQSILPCEENEVALSHLKAALQSKLDRTAKRQAQNVEGTMMAH